MDRKIKILVLILFAQFALLGFMQQGARNELAVFQVDELLLGFNVDQLDKIILKQRDKPDMTLVKQEADWKIFGLNNFPVSSAKFSSVFDRLFSMKKNYPIASSTASADYFRLEDSSFDRAIDFISNDALVERLYLSASSSFKKAYVRAGDDKPVYEINFSMFDLETKTGNWIDPDLLKLDPSTVSEIRLAENVVLKQNQQNWQLDNLSDTENLNQDALQSLLNQILHIRYHDVTAIAEKAATAANTVEFQFQIDSEGKTLEYLFYSQPESDVYWLKVSAYPYQFKVNKAMTNIVAEFKRLNLIETPTQINVEDEVPG